MRRLINACIQRVRTVRKALLPNFEIAHMAFFKPLWKVLVSSSRLNYLDDVLGHKMYLDEKDSLALSFYRIHEPEETAFFQRLIKPGNVVLDVGANIGYYTLLFAKQVGSSGKVYAFEPAPENFSLLKKNVELNCYDNVVLWNKAASSSAGTARLYLNDENRGDHRLFATSSLRQSVAVEMVRIDDVLPRDAVAKVDVIKMDTQGAEHHVLTGMQRLLERSRDVVLVVEFWPHGLQNAGVNPLDTVAMLRSWGFGVFTLGKGGNTLIPLDERAVLLECTVENEKHCDLICVRDAERVVSLLPEHNLERRA